MSIYAYVGMPGSGKTYDVVANQIIPALRSGRKVVTNIPLHEEIVRQEVPDAELKSFPVELIQQDPSMLDEYAIPGCVLIIDECWRLWPAGQKVHQVPEQFKKLLAEHRHMVDEHGNSMQIVLVTQDLAQIGAFARQLVEQTFVHTKLSHVGASGSYRVDVYQGPQTGPNPPRQARLREIFGRYDRNTFKFYQSHTMSRSGTSGANEKSVDGRGNIWKRPSLWIAAAGVLVAFIWGGRTAYGAFHNPDGKAAGASGATAGRPSSVRMPVGGTPVPARGVQAAAIASPRWRVVGIVHLGEDKDGAPDGFGYLRSSDGSTATVALRDCRLLRFETRCTFDGGTWSSLGSRLPAPPAQPQPAPPAVAEISKTS